MKEKMIEIAQRLKELRELSDIETEDIAASLGVPLETYRNYEEGKLDIPASVLYEIAQILKVDMGCS